jgi:hypothetical protein
MFTTEAIENVPTGFKARVTYTQEFLTYAEKYPNAKKGVAQNLRVPSPLIRSAFDPSTAQNPLDKGSLVHYITYRSVGM